MAHHQLVAAPGIRRGVLPEHPPPPGGKSTEHPSRGRTSPGGPRYLSSEAALVSSSSSSTSSGSYRNRYDPRRTTTRSRNWSCCCCCCCCSPPPVGGFHLAVQHDAIVRRGGRHSVKVEDARHVVGAERPQVGGGVVTIIAIAVRARWSAADPRYVPRGRMLGMGDGGYPLHGAGGGTGGHHGFQDV